MYLQRGLLALQLAYCLFQHANIHVETNRVDMSVLFASEQVARAAKLQIERGDFESRSQFAEFLQRCQPLACDLSQLSIRWNQQVSVRTPVRPAYSSAKLIHLR